MDSGSAVVIGEPEEETSSRSVSVYYSEELAVRIAELYMSGRSISAIARIEGMPSSSTIYNWIRDTPEFAEKMEGAREARGYLCEEKVWAIAEEAPNLHKEEVPGARLGFDAWAKLAEWNNPKQYGKRTTVQGDSSKPIVFEINTGFPALKPTEIISDVVDVTEDEADPVTHEGDDGEE